MPYFPEAPPAPPVEPAGDIEQFAAEYRASLPITGKFIYLNHASVGPLSDWVVAAAAEQFTQQQMDLTVTQDEWFNGWRLARQRIGELINTSKDNICIVPNTWAGLARAFSALPLGPEDEVLFPTDEFPSLYFALSELRARGCAVRAVESGAGDGVVRTADLLAALGPRTKLVATSWVNFFHGFKHDLDALGAACRANGTWLVVDAIQGLGQLALDVEKTGVHFVSCNGAKWLCSPLGSGFLYVAPDVPLEITPRLEGWFSMELNHDQYTDRAIQPKANANRFGTGTVPLANTYGLRRSCEVLLAAGPKRAEARALKLAETIAAATVDAGIRLVSDRINGPSAIVSMKLADCPALPDALKARRVAFSVREGAVRLSPHWYSDQAEVEIVNAIIRQHGP
ncbi:aminotransferase class V-fold PLP-dependent enzyme [bacterium]|nr:aminotransferase class V-fold PLP-dependent enzyme [bacterium]